ncbi:MAG: nuclear transport factor 2 family protein, partial [Nitrospirota bacterium]|nr:nuclear transport factor 2 family protein [Nitrospirota bacterium]
EDLENQKNNLQAQLDAGVKFNVQLRHPEVEVYGNVAVVTGYTVGTITSPDGTTRQVANRRTVVLIKQGDQWKAVHGHSSPLRGPQ